MRDCRRRGRFTLFSTVLLLCSSPQALLAQDESNYEEAQDAFSHLSRHDRNEVHLELMATGNFNALASDQFGRRLFDAISAFQTKEGLMPDGVLTPETIARLHDVGGRILTSWQMGFLDHPTTDASMVIPNHFGLVRTASPRGWRMENSRRTMSIDFSYFAVGEASLADIFGKLTAPQTGRRLSLQLLKSDYLAVSGESGQMSFYSRYIPVRGGFAGFTISWNANAYPNAGRIAVVMANELYAHRMHVDADARADVSGSASAGTTNPNASANGLPSGTLAFSEDVPMSSVPDPIAEAAATARADQEAERVRAAEQAKIEERAKAARARLVDDEERQKADAEAQAARDEAAAKLRKARFERASSAAKQVIDEASAFVKANPADPKLLDYVQQIADLNTTLTAGDPDDTEHRTIALNGTLQADADFTKFRAKRAEERQRQIARDLGDAVHTLALQRQFLIATVTHNPTSSAATKLLPLIKQAEGSIAAPDLDHVQTLVGQIDAVLQGAGMSNDFVASEKLAEQQASRQPSDVAPGSADKPSTASGSPVKTGLQLVATDKNAFLFKGDLQDVVLMFNTSPSAPHVVRNLRGDIVFNESRADVCLFGRGGEDDALGPLVRSTLSAYDTAKTIVLTGDPCNADRLASYDVVATRRSTFLRQDPQAALALIKAIEIDAFTSLVTVTDAQVKAAASADAVAATEIAADVDKGVREGFGLLLLAGGSPAICVVAQDQMDAHRQLLLSYGDKLASDMGTAPTLAPTSADGAFVNAKHGQCGAIYAISTDLKQLAAALKRDGVSFRFSSEWIGADDVQATAAKLQAEKDSGERQTVERQRRLADAQHLASLRAADEASKMANIQAASREKYGSTANAAQSKIAQDVKDYTDHPSDSATAARLFPEFATLYRNELANRWELMSENAELDDYGMSDFKGRMLETSFTRVTIGLKNRMLGDYKSECFLFGDIEDSEFSMRREPVVVSCDDDAALSRWKVQHGFQSVWTLR